MLAKTNLKIILSLLLCTSILASSEQVEQYKGGIEASLTESDEFEEREILGNAALTAINLHHRFHLGRSLFYLYGTRFTAHLQNLGIPTWVRYHKLLFYD